MLVISRSMKELLAGKFRWHFLSSFFCFATRCVCWLLPESSGRWFRND